MYFAIRFSDHRRVGLWLLHELNWSIYPRDIEGEPLCGLWRETQVDGGEKKPILNRKIRYLDEEIQKAIDNEQHNRLEFLIRIRNRWPLKTFLHIAYV
jgi:hypothetical protein